MEWNRGNTHGCPCKGCTDRYPACSDHCEKEAFKKWREKTKKAREAERKHRMSMDTFSDENKKRMWKKQRYGNQPKRHRSNDL